MKPRPHRSAMRWMRSRSNDLSPTLSAEQPMSIQRVLLGDFWDRYGREDFAETAFATAIGRLPAISQAGPRRGGASVRWRITCLSQARDGAVFFHVEAQLDRHSVGYG